MTPRELEKKMATLKKYKHTVEELNTKIKALEEEINTQQTRNNTS